MNSRLTATSAPIAIVGMGCMFPKARDLIGFWRSLRRGTDGIGPTPSTHWLANDYFDPDPKRPDFTYCARGGFLSPAAFDPSEFGIPPTILEATDTSQLLGLMVAKAALEDAGYGEDREFNRERVSVILGVTGLQELALPLGARLGHPIWRRALAEAGVSGNTAEEVVRRISDAYVGWQENSFPGLLGNVVAGRIANRLNLRGTNCVVDAACASSLSAAHLAVMELATGRSDMALAGGVDALNDIFMYMCFSKTPALSPTGDARPFSDDADGTVLGEGIGMIVLKRLDDAQRDGDRIYAVLRAIGSSSDGRSQSIYAPHAGGQARALRNAYQLAGFEPDSVGLIEAHGTGTKVGDVVEFEALKTVFGEAGTAEHSCALGSVKSQIGHTKAAAGVAGLIKAALAIYHRTLPPTIKVHQPNPKLAIEDSPFYLNTQLRPWIMRRNQPRRAGVSAFGFGGSNFHAVLEEHSTTLAEPAWDGSVQIIAMSAKSPEGIVSQLDEWTAALADENFGERHLAHLAWVSRKSFSATQPHRLVLIVTDGDDPKRVITDAREKLLASTDARSWQTSQAFYGCGELTGKVAFLFPGQGSQYPGMARDLACTFPEMIEALSEADAVASDGDPRVSELIYAIPVFDEAAKTPQTQILTRTEHAQPAIGAISLGMSRVLERFNIKPDLVAGHSYGELPALAISGRLDSAVLHRLSRLRGRLMAEGDDDRGAMLAVKAPLDQIEQLIASQKLNVVIANRNSPRQAVLSGPREEIAKAAAACRTAGLPAQALNVSGAFHSTLMESAAGPFRQALESIEFAPGNIPVFSGTTTKPYPAGGAARPILAGQLTTPVDFVGVVNALYDADARVFIEVGPRNVICGLINATLDNRPHAAMAVDASAGRNGGVLDLARVLAFLAAGGRRVDLTKWERAVAEPRKARMIVQLVGANLRPSPRTEQPEVSMRSMPATSIVPPIIKPVQIIPDEKEIGDDIVVPREIEMKDQNEATPVPFAPDAMRFIQEGLQAMQALQQQTAEAHQRFLEGQEQAHRTFQQLIEAQQRLFAGESVSSPPITPPTMQPAKSAVRTTPVAENPQVAPPRLPASVTQPGGRIQQPKISERSADPAAGPVRAGSAPGPNPKSRTSPAPVSSLKQQTNFASIVLDVVGEKTGYPREMIELDMDIEADLGIDSIKRVEIIAAVEERIPEFGGIKPEYMGSLRTLRQIVEFVGSAGGATVEQVAITPTAAPQASSSKSQAPPLEAPDNFAKTLLDVVAQLTGYPREMLELNMDMEADLGIDSIKRVEILAAVESRVPGLPPVKPDYMGSLRTLAQIVEYFATQGKTAAKPKQEVTTSRSAPSQQIASKKCIDSPKLERRTLTVIELPKALAGKLPIGTRNEIWITDDGRGLSRAIADRLAAIGYTVVIVSPDHPSEAPAALGGLIIVASAEGSEGLWVRHTEDFVKHAFGLIRGARRALHAGAADGGALLVTVSRMDSAFGLVGEDFDAAQGALAGLLKTAALEWPEVVCRALDVSHALHDGIAADAIVAELASEGPREIALDGQRRFGLELQPCEVSRGASSLHPGDVVVISGGARGVTAETAVALAEAVQPMLVLLGRSSLSEHEPAWLVDLKTETEIKTAILEHEFAGRKATPAELKHTFDRYMAQREIRQTLARIGAAGARARYECVDVRDANAVQQLLQRIRQEHGPIRGLIHGAGTLEDRRIEDKTDAQFANVFDTKVRGLDNLLSALRLDELRQVVLFSSVSGRFGNPGQIDYAAANEVLNKTAQRLAKSLPNCRVSAINWGPWDGGMVHSGLKRAFLDQGVGLIPLAAGAAALVDECCDTAGNVEVVIGSNLPSSVEDRPGKKPLIQATGGDVQTAFEHVLDVENHSFLTSHMLDARPVLPAAMIMEWLGQAALHANPGLAMIGLNDVRIFKGVVLDGPSKQLRFATSRANRTQGEFHVGVELSSLGQRPINHASATAILATAYANPPQPEAVNDLATRAYPMSVVAAYEDVLFHGEQFQTIEEIHGFSDAGIVTMVRSAPRPREWMAHPMRPDWLSDPLVIDAAFQLAILWCHANADGLCLPSYVAQYRQFRAKFPTDGVVVALRVTNKQRNKLISDVTFSDRAGGVIAKVTGCECTIDAALRNAFKRRSLIGLAT
jgi:acyl transferase domain-containing protein/NAD(P)-dependent dehydrogenase (short-subunit alcohol dehydrogenase family)/acyl carrier protein